MTRVLIVEDERGLRQALRINLRARDYEVAVAEDGRSALTAASREPPDAVVLDLGLPDIDGVEVIEGLRGWTQAPIIVLSARSGEPDKVVALDAGADDYVTKPFGMDELLARLRAALRRAAAAEELPSIETESFTVDLAAKEVRGPRRRAGPPHADRVARARGPGPQRGQARRASASCCRRSGARATRPRPTTCASTWPSCGASSSPIPSHPRYLITEPGIGYRFVLEPASGR